MKILAAPFLLIPAQVWAQVPISSVSPVPAQRGQTITVVSTLPPDAQFWLPKSEPPGVLFDCEAKPNEAQGTRLVAVGAVPTGSTAPAMNFTVLVPASLALGQYTVCVRYTSGGAVTWAKVPIFGDSGKLQVAEATGGPPPTITSVQPRVSYRDGDSKTGTYKVTVLGNGFSPVAADNEVLLRGRQIDVCWNCPNPDGTRAAGKAVNAHQLELTLPVSFRRDEFKGSLPVQVRVGAAVSADDDNLAVTLAPISRAAPLWIAAAIVGLLAVLIAVLLGVAKSAHQVAGVPLSRLSALFLDKATDTYSLSRAQFYVWTAAAVFGQTYLTIAWSFLQGRLEFPPVPEGLPGILAFSAGTAAVVETVNRSKPKGAGDVQPSFGDLITTGGMVVPERLQYLVWTVLGVLTFLILIVRSDPATIASLPPIPSGFLYLMGISSAGYLGGRMARKGGPVIDDIMAKVSSLDLELHGRNLSKNASFQVDGEDVTLDMLGEGGDESRRPVIVAKDDEGGDATMGKVLKFVIRSPKAEWLTRKSHLDEERRKHTLAIINPDGQKAEWPFGLAGPTTMISAAGAEIVNGTLKLAPNTSVTLDGSASRAEDGAIASFEWTKDGDVVGREAALNVTSAGLCQLKVTDAAGLTNTASVNVVAA